MKSRCLLVIALAMALLLLRLAPSSSLAVQPVATFSPPQPTWDGRDLPPDEPFDLPDGWEQQGEFLRPRRQAWVRKEKSQ